MKEQLISFETAKLAKEKGFPHRDSITHEAYNVNGELGSIFKFDKPYTILAPTQSLLQKWLREVHKIHIVINPYQNEFLDYTISVLTQHERAIGGFEEEGSYITYEEALEKGLQGALKLVP